MFFEMQATFRVVGSDWRDHDDEFVVLHGAGHFGFTFCVGYGLGHDGGGCLA